MSVNDTPPSRVGYLDLNELHRGLVPAALDESMFGGVGLRVPYLEGSFPEQWFWSDSSLHIGSDGKPIPIEPVPACMDYLDVQGAVGLVGCHRATGSSTRFGGIGRSAGVGAVSATYAVRGSHYARNYGKVNGFRSDIDGLSQWLDLWAHHTTTTMPKGGGPVTVRTTLVLPPNLRLAARLNLCATVHGTAPARQEPEMRYTSTTMLQTYSTTARPWNEHLDLHEAVRDLLRIAVWKPLAFQRHEVTSDEEKVIIGDGEVPRSRWLEVTTSATGIARPVWDARTRTLFEFQDVEWAGIGKWLRLRESNRRGLRPMMRLLEMRESTIDERLAQLGIAMEALGYQGFRDSGLSEKKADAKKLAARVGKLVDLALGCVPGVPDTFPQDFADSYNAVKHARRAEPNPMDLFELYRTGVRVLRAWVALRIGVSEDAVREGLALGL